MPTFSTVNTNDLLMNAMKVAEAQHRYIANNLANAETPGYTPTALDFQATLKAFVEGRGGFALRTARPRHFNSTEPHLKFERLAHLSKNDYNKVDVDEALADLAQNTSQYTTYARLLAKRFEVTKNMLNSLSR